MVQSRHVLQQSILCRFIHAFMKCVRGSNAFHNAFNIVARRPRGRAQKIRD